MTCTRNAYITIIMFVVAHHCARGVRLTELSSGGTGSVSMEEREKSTKSVANEANANPKLPLFGGHPKKTFEDEPCGKGIKASIMVANDYVKINAINWDTIFKQVDTFLQEQSEVMKTSKQQIEKYKKELDMLEAFSLNPPVSDELLIQLISGACEEVYGKECRGESDAVNCEGWKSCSKMSCGAGLKANQVESQEWAIEAFTKLAGKALNSTVSVDQGRASEFCNMQLKSAIGDHRLDVFCEDLCDGFADVVYQKLHSVNLHHVDTESHIKESLIKNENILKDSENNLKNCQIMKKDLSQLSVILKSSKAEHQSQRKNVERLTLEFIMISSKLKDHNAALVERNKELDTATQDLANSTQEENELKASWTKVLQDSRQAEVELNDSSAALSTIAADVSSITAALKRSSEFKVMLAVEIHSALELHHESIRDPLQATLTCIDVNRFQDPSSFDAASRIKEKARSISELCKEYQDQVFKNVSLSDDYRLLLKQTGTKLQPVLEADLATPVEPSHGSLIEASTWISAAQIGGLPHYERMLGMKRCEPWEDRIEASPIFSSDRTACQEACSALQKCTAITWLPSAEQKCFLFEKCISIVLPHEPGCYMRFPTGCPLQSRNASEWFRDLEGERQGSNVDKASCYARKLSIDESCKVKDTQMLFIPTKDVGADSLTSTTPLPSSTTMLSSSTTTMPLSTSSSATTDAETKNRGTDIWSLTAEGTRFKKDSSTKKATGMSDLCSPEIASKWQDTARELIKVVTDKQDEVKGVIDEFQTKLQALHEEAAELPGSPLVALASGGQNEQVCYDFPQDWKDAEGNGCIHYTKRCKDSKVMTAGGLELEASFNPENRYSAAEACCACGGGYAKANTEELVQLRMFIRKFKDTDFYNNYLKFWQVPRSEPSEFGTQYFMKMMAQLEESGKHLTTKKHALWKLQKSFEKRLAGLKNTIEDLEVKLHKAQLLKTSSEVNLGKVRALVATLKEQVADEEAKYKDLEKNLMQAREKLGELGETIQKQHRENTGVSSMLNIHSNYREAGD